MDRALKTQAVKGKTDTLDFVKTKKTCASNIIIKKMKRTHVLEKKYLQMYLISPISRIDK